MVIGWYYGYTRTVEAGFLQKKKKKSVEKNKKKISKISKKISKIPIEIYFIYIMGGLAEWVDGWFVY